MPYCRNFIDGIKNINFHTEQARRVQDAVLNQLYFSLSEAKTRAEASISSLTHMSENEPFIEEGIQNYKKNQTALIQALTASLEDIEQRPGFKLNQPPEAIEDPKAFVQTFSSYFRSLKHLAETLSDAPPAIKSLQTQLYIEVLKNLNPEAQEAELRYLSSNNLKDLVSEASSAFLVAPELDKEKKQNQSLVQMALFEQLKRRFTALKDKPINVENYQRFLNQCTSIIPDVGSSSILDDFSQYRSSGGQTLLGLIREIESSLDKDAIDLRKPNYIDLLKVRKSFLEQLRLGQDQRREYASKVQENLVRDLFFARNIHDLKLFSENPEVDKLYQVLNERRVLDSRKKVASSFDHYTIKGKSKDTSHPVNQLIPTPKSDELDKLKSELQHIRKQIGSKETQIEQDMNGIKVLEAKSHDPLYETEKKLKDLRAEVTNLRANTSPISRAPEKIKKAAEEKLTEAVNELRYLENLILTYRNDPTSITLPYINDNEAISQKINAIQIQLDSKIADIEQLHAEAKTKERDIALLDQELSIESKLKFHKLWKAISAVKDAVKNNQSLELSECIEEKLKAELREPEVVEVNGQIQLFFFDYSAELKESIQKASMQGKDASTIAAEVLKSKLLTNFSITRIPSKKPLSDLKREYQKELIDLLEKKKRSNTSSAGKEEELLQEAAEDNNRIDQVIEDLNQGELPKDKTIFTHWPEAHRLLTIYHELDKLSKEVNQTNISQLGLSIPDEILFRKLLELYHLSEKELGQFYSNHGIELSAPIKKAFEYLKKSNFHAAIHQNGMNEAINELYSQLGGISAGSKKDKEVDRLLENAQKVTLSSKVREEKETALQDIFSSNDSAATKIKKLAALFYEEYVSMNEVLKLNEKQKQKLKSDAINMAGEVLLIHDRTSIGQPVISEREKSHYFSVISTIAQAMGSSHLSEFQFKVKHGLKGVQEIDVNDESGKLVKKVQVDLGEEDLPYSLIKPPGEDFIFSYGGSRGFITPFEGLDEKYFKKRLLGHSKLLGVGQYGTVKEVESLLTGLNQALKTGYLAGDTPVFNPEIRKNPMKRPLTSREDLLFEIERLVLEQLQRARGVEQGEVKGWVELPEKENKKRTSIHTPEASLKKYYMLMNRAAGESWADTVNRHLNHYAKQDRAYHDETFGKEVYLEAIKQRTALARAMVKSAKALEDLGFSHNDIKPENFLYVLKRSAGLSEDDEVEYEVEYIDMATNGFSLTYEPKTNDEKIASIFESVFGFSPPISEETHCQDESGRFVDRDEKGAITYGIRPNLEILHGARNCTVPYISPGVLGENREKRCIAGKDKSLNTLLPPSSPEMDNWSLLASTFGICNRQAYFELVKGRAIADYVVPDVLGNDGGEPQGLRIENLHKFNEYFACGPEVTQAELDSGEVYSNPKGVMYIPSNQREGGAVHLYRFYKQWMEHIQSSENQAELNIAKTMKKLLDEVYQHAAEGRGYPKEALEKVLKTLDGCIHSYQQLHDKTYLSESDKRAQWEAARISLDKDGAWRAQDFKVFCTDAPKAELQTVLGAITSKKPNIHTLCLAKDAPIPELLEACIQSGQEEICSKLIDAYEGNKTSLISLIKTQGLFHQAAQSGMRQVSDSLVKKLKELDATEAEIFSLMMEYYNADSKPPVLWKANCFHIAIRNHDFDETGAAPSTPPSLLSLILEQLPQSCEYENEMKSILQLSAQLGYKSAFEACLTKYNQSAKKPLNADDILLGEYDLGLSPYHLFMREANNPIFDVWGTLSEPSKKQFLLDTKNAPLLIAASHGNAKGVLSLLEKASPLLTEDEKNTWLLQTDESSRSPLNFLLSYRQYSEIETLLNWVSQNTKQSQETVIKWLSSAPQVNPLRQLLRIDKGEVKTQFTLLHLLLDKACSEAYQKDAKYENGRVACLLLNQAWLNHQAKKESNHSELKSLLLSNKLSWAHRRILLSRLEQSSEDESVKRFYKNLLKQIQPKNAEDTQERINMLLPQVDLALLRQQGDVSEVLSVILEPDIKHIHAQANTIESLEKIIIQQNQALALFQATFEDSFAKQEDKNEAFQDSCLSTNRALIEKIQALEATHKQSEAELSTKITNLSDEIASHRGDVAKQQEELEKLRAEYAAKIDAHEIEVKQLRSEQAVVMQQMKDAAEIRLTEVGNEKDKLQKDCDLLRLQISEIQSKYEASRSELDVLRQSSTRTEEELIAAQRKVDSLEHLLSSAQVYLARSEASVDLIAQKASEVVEAYVSASAAFHATEKAQLQRELMDAQSRLQNLEAQSNEQIEKLASKVKEKEALLKVKEEAFKFEILEVTNKYQSSFAEMTRNLGEMQRKLDEKDSLVKKLESQLETISKTIETTGFENKELLEAKARLEAALEKAEEEKGMKARAVDLEIQELTSASQVEVDKVRGSINELELQVTSLSEKNASLAKQLKEKTKQEEESQALLLKQKSLTEAALNEAEVRLDAVQSASLLQLQKTLDGQCSVFDALTERHEKELAILKEELMKSSDKRAESIERRISELQVQHAKKADGYESRIEGLRAEYRELLEKQKERDEISKLELNEKINQQAQDLLNSQAKASELEEQLTKEKVTHASEIEERLNKYEVLEAFHRETIERLGQDHAEAILKIRQSEKLQLESFEAERSQLTKKSDDLQSETELLKAQLNEVNARLEKQTKTQSEERDTANKQKTELEHKLEETETELRSTQRRGDELNEQMRQTIESYAQKYAADHAEMVSRLTSDLETYKKKLTEAQAQTNTLQRAELDKKIGETQAQVILMKTQFDEEKANLVAQYEPVIASQKKELGEAEIGAQALNKSLETMEKRIEILSNEKEVLEALIKKAGGENLDLREKLEQVTRSLEETRARFQLENELGLARMQSYLDGSKEVIGKEREHYQSQLARLSLELERSKEGSQSQKTSLEKEIAALRGELEKKERDHENSIQEMRIAHQLALEVVTRTLQHEKNSSAILVAELQAKELKSSTALDEAEARIRTLTSEAERLEKTLAEKKHASEKNEAELRQKLEVAKGEFEKKSKQAGERASELTGNIRQLEFRLEKASNQTKRMQDDLLSHISSMGEQQAATEAKIKTIYEGQLKALNDRLSSQTGMAQEEQRSLGQKISQLEEQLRRQKEEFENERKERERGHQSALQDIKEASDKRVEFFRNRYFDLEKKYSHLEKKQQYDSKRFKSDLAEARKKYEAELKDKEARFSSRTNELVTQLDTWKKIAEGLEAKQVEFEQQGVALEKTRTDLNEAFRKMAALTEQYKAELETAAQAVSDAEKKLQAADKSNQAEQALLKAELEQSLKAQSSLSTWFNDFQAQVLEKHEKDLKLLEKNFNQQVSEYKRKERLLESRLGEMETVQGEREEAQRRIQGLEAILRSKEERLRSMGLRMDIGAGLRESMEQFSDDLESSASEAKREARSRAQARKGKKYRRTRKKATNTPHSKERASTRIVGPRPNLPYDLKNDTESDTLPREEQPARSIEQKSKQPNRTPPPTEHRGPSMPLEDKRQEAEENLALSEPISQERLGLTPSIKGAHFSFIQRVMSEIGFNMGAPLMEHLISIENAEQLQRALDVHEGWIDAYFTLISRGQAHKTALLKQWHAAVGALVEDEGYFKEVKASLGQLHQAYYDFTQCLEAIKKEENYQKLQRLASTYSDKAMGRSVANKTYTQGQYTAFPRKVYYITPEGQGIRLSRDALVREAAQARLEAVYQTYHDANVTKATARQGGGVPAFGLEQMRNIIKEDKAMLEIAGKTPAAMKKRPGIFFKEDSFKERAEAFLAESFMWLNPAFQASSTRYAQRLSYLLEQWGVEVDGIMSALMEQKHYIEARLAVLPKDTEVSHVELQEEIRKHRAALEKALDKVEQALLLPTQVYDRLHGTGSAQAIVNPLDTNGVLERANEAKFMESMSLTLSPSTLINVSFKDYDEQDDALKQMTPKTPLTTLTSAPPAQVGGAPGFYDEVLRVPPGKVRVYELSHEVFTPPTTAGDASVMKPEVVGRFSEKRTDRGNESQFSVLTFPPSTGIDRDGRVKFAMAMMFQVWSGLKHPPSKKHPIYLSGKNPEELKYLAAAACAIQEMMGEKIEPGFLDITSSDRQTFSDENWQQVLGIGTGGFGIGPLKIGKGNDKEGFYEQFKAAPKVKDMAKIINAVDKEKFLSDVNEKGLKEGQKSAQKARGELNTLRGKYTPPSSGFTP